MDYEKIISQLTSEQVDQLFHGKFPKKHTIDTLVKILDLEHPIEFEARVKTQVPLHYSLEQFSRQSGRTTRMLLNACVAVQYQPVLILGHNQHFTDTLQQKLYEMCTEAGISNTENIVRKYIPLNVSISEALKGYGDLKVFEDHYRIEVQWRKPTQ